MAEYAGLTELVWLTNDARAENIHREYLLEILFAQVAISERSMAPASREPVSGAIVVFSTDDAVVDPALLDFFKANPDNIYVALSNESLNHDTACYAALRTVIRPYFDPRIGQENTCFIPNGSVNGYHNPELEFDFAQRESGPGSDLALLAPRVRKSTSAPDHPRRKWSNIDRLTLRRRLEGSPRGGPGGRGRADRPRRHLA